MKTDRELLELAAKAAGLYAEWTEYTNADPTMIVRYKQPIDGISGYAWNPLTDDGDALRLAFSLGMGVDMCACWIQYDGEDELDVIEFDGGSLENVRRAIVRAAATIGEFIAQ